MSKTADPREGIVHPINIGQIYKDSRSSELSKILYLDEDVALLRDKDGHHRIIPRKVFDRYVGSGRYELDEDAETFDYAGRMEALLDEAERLESVDGRKASHKAEAFREALALLTEETRSFESMPFEELDGIGDKAAANLRDAGYSTTADVQRASDDELLEVGWVGEKGVASMRDYVER